jgi:acyl carrier protein
MKVEVDARIRKIFSAVLNEDANILDADFILKDNWDSLAQMETILLVEEEYEIEFPIDQIPSVSTVGDFQEIINGHNQ